MSNVPSEPTPTSSNAVSTDPASPLPHRISGQLDIPEPERPLYFETREAVLVRVRDALERYESPAVTEREDFRGWMQPAPEENNATEPEE